MATTTNYGWTTPDDTALVKDGAAAIRTLGSSIDTTTKNLNPETTLGDIVYRSSTANVKTRLGIGSTGNVLTVVGGVPAWSAPAGGGKVLQVIYGSTSTSFSSTTNTFADTGLTATITPSSASSKVLLLINQIVGKVTGDTYIASDVLRNGTSIVNPGTFDISGYAGNNGSAANNYIGAISASILDTPASTSALTYKTQLKNPNAAGTVFANQFALSTMILMEIGA